MSRSILSKLTVAITLVVSATLASAQTPPSKPPPDPQGPTKPISEDDLAKAQRETKRPWADGVSAGEQQAALGLFKEANTLLKDQRFTAAVDKYREALGHWKHPAIYYNLALALVYLKQPLETYDALSEAMKYDPVEAAEKYGSAPLDKDKFDTAKGYMVLTEGAIGSVEYTVNVEGATLVLDGKEVFTGPGTYKARISAGEHTVVARADGYTPVPLSVKILGGAVSAITIPMYTDADLTRTKQKMPTWVPYTVLGGGVVVAAVGALLHVSAKTGFDDYDQAIATCARADQTGGCTTLPAGVADMKSSAESKQSIAAVAYVAGGLAVAAGVALVIINRPKTFRIDPTKGSATEVAITPVVGIGQAGFAVSGSF